MRLKKLIEMNDGGVKFIKEIDDERTIYKFSIDDKKLGQVVFTENYPEYYFMDEDLENETVANYVDEFEGETIYNIESFKIEEEFRNKGLAKKLLQLALNDFGSNKNFILNASPEFNTSLNKIVNIYSKVGFKKLFDQGNNIIMIK